MLGVQPDLILLARSQQHLVLGVDWYQMVYRFQIQFGHQGSLAKRYYEFDCHVHWRTCVYCKEQGAGSIRLVGGLELDQLG